MQTPTAARTSTSLLVPVVLLVVDGVFNAVSFFIPLISLQTGKFTGIDRPIPIIVVVCVLAAASLIAAWGLQSRHRWGRTVGIASAILLLLLAVVGVITPIMGGQLDPGPIIDIPLNSVVLVFLFRSSVKQALA